MPEISEVARIVHFIRKHLVNKTLTKVIANHDDIVYGKVGTSAAEFEKHMTGKKIIDAGQQGKYFWIIMSSPPHPVMHFGMSGWLKMQNEHTYYYRKTGNEPDEEWPPRHVKFLLTAEGGGKSEEAAFVDPRRLGRIRLLDCDAKEIRNNSPLKENGPDPVIDKDLVSLEWLTEKCKKKKVPIKAMLLDQSIISGIGNWVGDEVMYNAKMHPEQYANTLRDSQIKQLHKSIHYVCGLACELLGDSDQFPEDWLFKHRWRNGQKAGHKLPNGNKIEFLKVGGRTSAVVPAVQKKTGPVAGDLGESSEQEGEEAGESDEKPIKKKPASKKRKVDEDENEDFEEAEAPPKKPTTKRGKLNGVKAEDLIEAHSTESRQSSKKGKKAQISKVEAVEEIVEQPKKMPARGKAAKIAKEENVKVDEPIKTNQRKKANVSKPTDREIKEENTGRRRSDRLRK